LAPRPGFFTLRCDTQEFPNVNGLWNGYDAHHQLIYNGITVTQFFSTLFLRWNEG